MAGSATIGTLEMTDNALLSLQGPAADLIVTELFSMGPSSRLAAGSGAKMQLHGADFAFASSEADSLAQLAKLTLQVLADAAEATTIQPWSEDSGSMEQQEWTGQLGQLIIGAEGPAIFSLAEVAAESPTGPGKALYVEKLIVGPGSTLALGETTIYYRTGQIDPTASIDNPANLVLVPEPTTMLLLSAAGLVAMVQRRRLR